MAKDFVRIRKIPGLNQDLTQIQSNIDEAISQIQELPPLRGVMLAAVSINGDTVLDHGLGRTYQGFLIARLNANAVVYESATINPQPSTQIILTASAPCVANVWVY